MYSGGHLRNHHRPPGLECDWLVGKMIHSLSVDAALRYPAVDIWHAIVTFVTSVRFLDHWHALFQLAIAQHLIQLLLCCGPQSCCQVHILAPL